MLGYTYARNGELEKAEEILLHLLKKLETQFVPPFMIATIYMGLNDTENALHWLEEDINVGGQGLFIWGLKRDPTFEKLKNNPRFQSILNNIH